nr:uncharacterized protein LOC111853477 [Paramormyrops kingsleyae]
MNSTGGGLKRLGPLSSSHFQWEQMSSAAQPITGLQFPIAVTPDMAPKMGVAFFPLITVYLMQPKCRIPENLHQPPALGASISCTPSVQRVPPVPALPATCCVEQKSWHPEWTATVQGASCSCLTGSFCKPHVRAVTAPVFQATGARQGPTHRTPTGSRIGSGPPSTLNRTSGFGKWMDALEAADRYQQAKWNVTLAVGEVKTQVWKEFGMDMAKNLVSFEEILAKLQATQEGEADELLAQAEEIK